MAQYADAKRLSLSFLRGLGLGDLTYQGAPAIRIPFRGADGAEVAVQFRLSLQRGEDGDDNRFRWKSGARPVLYGLWRLQTARAAGSVVIVEGASDVQTLWNHDIPAVGLPGAGNWNEERDAQHFEDIPTIYVVIEPDSGGAAVQKWLARSGIRSRVLLVSCGGYKDPSNLYLADPDHFRQNWQQAIEAAVPWTDRERDAATAVHLAAWAQCAALARQPDILECVAEELKRRGVVGEGRTLRLLYLVVTTRLLQRLVSIAIKGPSAAGKSYAVEQVLSLFPASAYYALSAMSEKALAYSEEPLQHRFLVIYEAAGLQSDFASYLLRSLLSEGRVRYETVERTSDGLRPRLIDRAGPAGLIVTTTAAALHPENETRLLSVTVTDTPEQTRQVLLALAGAMPTEDDPAPWHALQVWLQGGEHRVTIPFATKLAESIPPVSLRLRRDFGNVLNLIRAYALLHRANREQDSDGQIIATIADYAAVRELVADLVADGVGVTVPLTTRETVAAVARLVKSKTEGGAVTLAELVSELGLDKSVVSRRVRVALDGGYLCNLEGKRGRPARIVLGEPLPGEVPVLPDPSELAKRCSVAVLQEEVETLASLVAVGEV